MKQQFGYYCLSRTSAKVHRDFIYLSSANVNRDIQRRQYETIAHHPTKFTSFIVYLFSLWQPSCSISLNSTYILCCEKMRWFASHSPKRQLNGCLLERQSRNFTWTFTSHVCIAPSRLNILMFVMDVNGRMVSSAL